MTGISWGLRGNGWKKSLLAGAALLAIGHPAWAQSENDAKSPETVIVTGLVPTTASAATKTDTPILVTPQSISVISRDQLTLQNPQDISQAISYSSGVTPALFGYDPRFAQFQVRGFSELYNGVYQDGLRVFGSDFIAPLLEPYGLQQMEIVRGPTSVLYGQNAPGGLVNLDTKRPQADFFGEAQIQVGSYDRYDGRLDINSPLTDDGTLLARFTGVYREAGTQYANTPDDETYLAPAITWKPWAGTTLTVLGSFQRVAGGESDEMYASYMLPPGYPQTVYQGEKDFNQSTQRNYSIGYLLDQSLGGAWTLHQSFRYTDAHSVLQFPNVTGFVSPTEIGRQAERLTNSLASTAVDTNVTGKLSTGPLQHTLIFGVDYQNAPFSELDLTGDAPPLNYFTPNYGQPIPTPTTLASAAHQRTEQTGIYAQDQIAYGEHWFLTGGLRQDWASVNTNNIAGYNFFGNGIPSQQDSSALTGRAGLVYLSDIGLAPYLSYSTSFVPQSGTDYYGHPFDPLTGRQYEAGLRYMPKGGWATATVSIYDLTEQNVLSSDPALTHIGFQVETGAERSRGVEFETILTPLAGLYITGAYTYDDVRITKTTDPTELNHQPGNTPPTEVSIFADYTLQDGPLAGFGGGAGLRHASTSYDGPDNQFRNGSQTYVDADLHYDMEKWRIALNATNLADTDTPICFGGVCNFSRGRSFIGSVTRKF